MSSLPDVAKESDRYWSFLTLLAVIVGGCLIAWESLVHSPNLDEVGHLPAGCLVAGFGRYDLYKVNPPLVKGIAAIPVVLFRPQYDWSRYVTGPGVRYEWAVGYDMVSANGVQAFWLFTMARWMLLSLWLVGCIALRRWVVERHGAEAAFATMVLWCSSPQILGWTATLCADSPAASIGVLCLWTFRTWLKNTNWMSSTIAGVVLGIGLLTKTSWFILVPLYPLLALCHKTSRNWKGCGQLAILGFVALYVVNAGYGFDRSFTKLENFRFASVAFSSLTGDGSSHEPAVSPSRTWIGRIPVPLPASMVEGIDLQKHDFEVGNWSYLRGEHRFGGWWYWYIYALLVKTPASTIALFLVACGWSISRVQWRQIWRRLTLGTIETGANAVHRMGLSTPASAEEKTKGIRSPPSLHENLILLAPAIALFLLVSSQTGFSRYLRYVLPCYPFIFMWMSQIFAPHNGLPKWMRRACWGLLAWSVFSSVSVFPHSMSYFNEIVGGPENGPAHLIDASIDWGQDLLFLAEWQNEHPEAKPFYSSLYASFDPTVAGIAFETPPPDPRYFGERHRRAGTGPTLGPRPGWYAVSVHMLYSRTGKLAYLRDFEKVDMVGYSIYIYHITDREVADWNKLHDFTTASGSERM